MRTLDHTILGIYNNLNAMHSMDKEPVAAACWNWALYGLQPLPVADPDLLFGYVNRGEHEDEMRQTAETKINTNTGNVWNNLQSGQPLRTALNQIRVDYDSSTNDEPTRNNIRDAVFELSLQAAGFTISAVQTPYRICMFEPNDVVMWDHWWLEINGAVVETVTGHQLHAYSNVYLAPAFNHPRNRVANKGTVPGLSVAQQARVHSRFVTSLQDQQAGWLEVVCHA